MKNTKAVPMPDRAQPGAAAVTKNKAPNKKSTARSRPKPALNDERGRETRTQEARSEIFERVDESQPYQRPTTLEAPPPLPGMKQRWIRVGLTGSEDRKNLARKLREGWRAREANTMPKNFHAPTVKHGAFAGAVMVEGMLLCHMPMTMAKKRERFMRDQTRTRTKAVNESLLRVNQGAGGGFGPIKKGEESKVVREVARQTAADEEIEL